MVQILPTPKTADSSFPSIQAKLASCSQVVGEAFFPVMVETLAEALSARWVFLSILHPLDRAKACTVEVWNNGPGENFEYDLKGSPCENIVGQGACCYPDNVAGLFPRDQMLKDMGAESYVGTPLRSSAGQVLGLLAVLDEKPFENAEQASEVIELFSGRAAAELERLATASLNERLGRIVEDSVSEVYIFNANNYRFELVNRGARENLGYSMEELRQLTPWDIKPQFTKDEFIQHVTPLRNGEIANQIFETQHQRKDGSIYAVAVQLQYFPGVENLYYASISDITDRKRAEEAQAHLAAIVSCSSEAIISKALDGTIKSWNNGAEKIFGYSADEMIGKSIRLLIPAERQNEEEDILAQISRAEQVDNYETVRLCRDGREVDVSVTVSPIFDSTGTIVGASKIAHDISDRKLAEAREQLLMGEVNHRAKNMLTLVQVIARQTAANDAHTFAQRFDERILALSASHDVLVNSHWQNVPLDELVRSQLGHFQDIIGAQIKLSGPSLKITAPAAQAIGMALHELATNAAKYGALSNEDGTIEIDWKLDESDVSEQRLLLDWIELGGPEVSKPSRAGFGSKVVDQILEASINGEVTLDWLSSGLVCHVSCPAENVLDNVEISSQQSRAASCTGPSSNSMARRILVVEDEILIGMEISGILKDAGFEIFGPVTTARGALALLENEMCDAAVLDINLGKETSAPIAEWLSEAGTPYLSISGRNMEDRPAVFGDSPHLAKPIQSALLVRELGQLLESTTNQSPRHAS